MPRRIGGIMIYEATCDRCGETFNPLGETDLIHGVREDGDECGGPGRLVGTWFHSVAEWSDLARTATQRRDESIRAMRAAGATLREIGEWAGLSHTQIRNILDK
jgi:hypothetical protein